MLLPIDKDKFYIIELTVSFEGNVDLNLKREHDKYLQLTHDLSSMHRCVRLSNLSISSLGVVGDSCKSFIEMCKGLDVERQHKVHILRKTTNIIFDPRTISAACEIMPGPTLASVCIIDRT